MVALSLQQSAEALEFERTLERQLLAIDPDAFRGISIRSRQNAIVLTGLVSSFYVRSLVFQHLKRLAGAAEIVDAIEVWRPQSHAARSP